VGRLLHMAYVRPETLEKLVRAVHAHFDLPDVEFVMMTADHADQVVSTGARSNDPSKVQLFERRRICSCGPANYRSSLGAGVCDVRRTC